MNTMTVRATSAERRQLVKASAEYSAAREDWFSFAQYRRDEKLARARFERAERKLDIATNRLLMAGGQR